ncbi:MAG TPA: tetratricopeptide repeat protein [Verrucomicrobiae bacterium]|jgi:tetratricopeptide (TPR) repeat protein|nr:tetratricopeptide repeat protein [Verrucomicrobiae bacterium]
MMKTCLYCSFFFLAFLALAPAQSSDSKDNQPNIQPGTERSQSTSKKKRTPTPQQPSQDPDAGPAENAKPNESVKPNESASSVQGESSSKDSLVDFHNQPIPKAPANSGQPAEYPFDPHKAAKDVEVGQFYLSRKNYRAALDRFREALLYKPNDAEATYYMARTLEKMDLPTQAYDAYSKYLEILPQGPSAKESREGMKRLESRLDAAGTEPEKLAALDIETGEVLLARNDFAAAQGHFERAVRLSPENPVAYLRLAQSLQGLQRLDEARLYYRKYIELQPNGKYVSDARRAINDISLVLGK